MDAVQSQTAGGRECGACPARREREHPLRVGFPPMILNDSGSWREAARHSHEVKRVYRQGQLVAVLVVRDDGVDVFDPACGWCGWFRTEEQARQVLRLPVVDEAA